MIIKSSKSNNRNIYLDYIRAIACICIVLYHYTQRFNELYEYGKTWPIKFSWGYMAITVFYILSGYLAVVKNEESSLLNYIKKKVLRLYPAYWAAIIITFIVTSILLPSRAVSFKDMLVNLTMLESFIGVPLVDGAYWTLANELVFYAYIAIVVVILKRKDKLQICCVVWLVFLFLYSLFESDSLFVAALGKLIAKQYGHMFIVGISLHSLFNDTQNKKSVFVAIISLVLSFIYQYITFDSHYFLFFTISTTLICGCIYLNKEGIDVPNGVREVLYPLEFIAGFSYPLYLIHQNIGYAILCLFPKKILNYEVVIVLPIGVTFIIAYIIHYYIEKPIFYHFSRKQNC